MIVDQDQGHVSQLRIQFRIVLDQGEVCAIVLAVLAMRVGYDETLSDGQEKVLSAMLQIHGGNIAQPRIWHGRLGTGVAHQGVQGSILLLRAQHDNRTLEVGSKTCGDQRIILTWLVSFNRIKRTEERNETRSATKWRVIGRSVGVPHNIVIM